jgi:hypothetical protein
LPSIDLNNFANIDRTTDLKRKYSSSNFTADIKVFDATSLLNNFETTNTIITQQ